MSRAAIYPTTHTGVPVRVVSAPNGLWQLQQRDNGAGRSATDGQSHFDPWFNRGPATDHDIAMSGLGPVEAPKKVKTL